MFEREIAGIFAGAGALLLIWQGHHAEAGIILGSIVGFFVGEKNGERNITKKPEETGA